MQIDTKAAVIVVSTLLTGAALGAVGVGALTRQRAEQMQQLRQPLGFVEHMEEVIHPRDSAQRAAIRPFLERTAHRNDSILRGAHEQLRIALDSLRANLAPLLEPDQRDRLAREGQLPGPLPPRNDRPPREGGRGNPPPQGGPPPRRDGPPPDDGGAGGPPPRRAGPPPDGRGPGGG